MREFDLLSHVYDANVKLPSRVTLAPGDDMGGLKLPCTDVLVTVDQLADGVHVDVSTTALERVGRKAMTRNLSDVAAMGAEPMGAVVAVSLPRDFGDERALALFDAIRQTGLAYDCPLFGGDISMWDGRLLVSVTVLATPWKGTEPVLRKGAQPGDVICVTGELGGSLQDVNGRIHHLDFEPRLNVGQTLVQNPKLRPHCMIDLSDGLSRDIGHLCRASGVGARINTHQLPVSEAAKQAASHDGKPAWQHALADGEDYELCFTMTPQQFEATAGSIAGVKVTAVGTITADLNMVICDDNGQTQPLVAMGWEHQGSNAE